MTTLNNAVQIDAPPEQVWATLAQLDALQDYDPAIAKSQLEIGGATGLGASRRCELKDGGWFRERVTVWEPHTALALELHACSLPVRRLRHVHLIRGTLLGELGRTAEAKEALFLASRHARNEHERTQIAARLEGLGP